jgi:hypothetical protein
VPYRVFEIPAFHEFVDALGVGPDQVEGEEALRLVLDGEDEQLEITLDPPGRSVRVRWTRRGALLVDAFREGAVAVRLHASRGSSSLAVLFDTDCQHGLLEIQTTPKVELRDRLLLH